MQENSFVHQEGVPQQMDEENFEGDESEELRQEMQGRYDQHEVNPEGAEEGSDGGGSPNDHKYLEGLGDVGTEDEANASRISINGKFFKVVNE